MHWNNLMVLREAVVLLLNIFNGFEGLSLNNWANFFVQVSSEVGKSGHMVVTKDQNMWWCTLLTHLSGQSWKQIVVDACRKCNLMQLMHVWCTTEAGSKLDGDFSSEVANGRAVKNCRNLWWGTLPKCSIMPEFVSAQTIEKLQQKQRLQLVRQPLTHAHGQRPCAAAV